ncbi:alkaline phosphatase [Exiguobacterium sp. s149]|uniref:alkaline phosphatase n=1 Tax=Exiguobacterium TaxID=33986 RepID=UPI001BE7D3A4|nr:alkaline phosphatase [Exiguobacterium sp. s149]
MSKQKWMIGTLAFGLTAGAVVGGSGIQPEAGANAKHNQKQVKNVIFMIPDGYSASYATNYRWYADEEETTLDQHLTGMMRTYSANSKVTDSAAAGTAMATGVKTNNGTISMDPNGKELTSVLEKANQIGKATGLVATSTITHATPAVFASHVASRASEAEIAKQYMDELEVDVLLGGGQNYFTTEQEGGLQKEDLIARAEAAGYTYATNADELETANASKLLGLFAPEAMAPELDREMTEEPSLAEMTTAALTSLNQDKDGFFLMVEGSQIDWAGHAHDAAWAMKDSEAFHDAFQKAIQFAMKDKQTLVVVAGDHDTGGMSVGGYNEYVAKPEVLRSVTATGDFMVDSFDESLTNVRDVVKRYTSLTLTEAEVKAIQAAESPKRTLVLNEIISKRAYVGWTTSQHTGVDVPLYAYGPQHDRFTGVLDNTDVPKQIMQALKLK